MDDDLGLVPGVEEVVLRQELRFLPVHLLELVHILRFNRSLNLKSPSSANRELGLLLLLVRFPISVKSAAMTL